MDNDDDIIWVPLTPPVLGTGLPDMQVLEVTYEFSCVFPTPVTPGTVDDMHDTDGDCDCVLDRDSDDEAADDDDCDDSGRSKCVPFFFFS